MATNTILMSTFTNCPQIAWGTSSISQVWFGNNQIWSSSTPVSDYWINNTVAGGNDTNIALEYTAPANVKINSYSMTLNYPTAVANWYNPLQCIWLKGSGSPIQGTRVTGTFFITTTGITMTSSTTFSGVGYTYKRTFDTGSEPTLTSGSTYLFTMGERYVRNIVPAGYYVLGGASPPATSAAVIPSWDTGNSPTTQGFTYQAGKNGYLTVSATPV